MDDEQGDIDNILRELLSRLSLVEGDVLGQGEDGYVSRLSDGSVVKVTMMEGEAACALALMVSPNPGLMKIYAVARLSEDLYAIIREDATDVPIPSNTSLPYMKYFFSLLDRQWRCRHPQDEGVRWEAPLEKLRVEGNPLFQTLSSAWDYFQCMHALDIRPFDMHLMNMGIVADVSCVLRDMGLCDAPHDKVKEIKLMEVGDIKTSVQGPMFLPMA